MLSNDFYGKKGFIWWSGVVEDRKDPLYVGYYKVRMYGIHRDDVPVGVLPWVQADANIKAQPGDWAYGFFLDGEHAQMPIMMGVTKGIDSHVKLAGKQYDDSPGPFKDPRARQKPTTKEEIALRGTEGVENGPRLPSHIVGRLPGEPSYHSPRLSYGNLVGTGIQSTNSNLQYSCDILGIIKVRKGAVLLKTSEFMNSVRALIDKLIAALGLDPTGMISKAISLLKKVTTVIQEIRKFINEIREVLRLINEVLALINCVINAIKNLPALFARQIQNCLQNLINEFVSGMSSAFGSVVSPDIAKFYQEATGLISDVEKTKTEINQTATNASATVENIASVPESISQSTEAGINNLTLFADNAIRNTTNQFKENSLSLLSNPLDTSNTSNTSTTTT